MLWWIVGGAVVALIAIWLVAAQGLRKAVRKSFEAGQGEHYTLYAGTVIVSALLDFVQEPGPDGTVEPGRLSPERVTATATAVGRKLFGEAFTEKLLLEATRDALGKVPAPMSKMHETFAHADAVECLSVESKDRVIRGALAALHLNFQQPAEELLPLRAYAGLLYEPNGGPAEGDRRLLGFGGQPGLLEQSAQLSGEILADLQIARAMKSQVPPSA